MNFVVQGAFYIAKDPFDSLKVSLCWCLKLLGNLINRMSDVGSCESEVLEAAN